ncbi:MAG: DNA gyrase subunit A, partial [Oscillospiraceae bacterium]|nr:DNA gyrase subunit A [Oscillospiraceae bacterium]
YPLIDGHGNFGSVDGDPPAAYRYTEARMAKIADEMVRDIDKETVDWDPNFDETRKEPRVMPSRFPNLLVNGSSGIAVGMATNMPPHNLNEVIDAAVAELENPDISVAELMQYIKGPDFPTKGIIMGRGGIRQAYETGRGKITVRARTEFEEFGKDNRIRIIVTELPYQVNKRQLIGHIAELVKDKRVEGISDIRDETDRNGMRIVIELKRDANAQVVLNHLLSLTQMQTTFSIINLALVNDQKEAKVLPLKTLLDEYLTFQEEVLVRRTKYDLKKAQERAHLLEGLLIAQNNIDEVIKIIRNSYDNAKQNLMERFGLSDIQAQAICDMRLIALQGLNREKLENEYKELEDKIAYFQSLLANPELIKGVLRDELLEIKDKYGDDRRTEIQDVIDDINIEDLIEEQQCVYTLTKGGYIKRLGTKEYASQNRGGKGIKAQTLREEDYIETLFTASSHAQILFFTSLGKVYKIKGYRIPEASRTARGTNIVNVLPLDPGEKVSAMVHVDDIMAEGMYMNLITKQGTIKRMELSILKNIRSTGIRALNLVDDDELIAALLTNGNNNIVIATHDGMSINMKETDARAMGREAAGVRGIKLRDGDYVIGAEVYREDAQLLSITEKGFGKRTSFNDYPEQNRGGLGVKNYNCTEKTGKVAAVMGVMEDVDIMIIADDGTMIRTPVSNISLYGRTTMGVKVMRLSENAVVTSIARAEKEEDEETEETVSEETAE